MAFNEITSEQELQGLFDQSAHGPVLLFKHSTTCPISTDVYQSVGTVECSINVVVVQRSRNLSNEIAQRTGVRHESPQALVIRNGEAVYHASHYDISAEEIDRQMNQ